MPDDDPANKQLKREFWKAVNAYRSIAGNTFFQSMDKMVDADQLYQYVSKYPHFILSATGNHFSDASNEKRSWVRSNYGHVVANSAIFVRDAKDKAQHALPHRILIDDRRKAIGPWVEAGGIGILHTSAERTISELKELGL